jgi:hypothetical protein
MNSTNAIVAVLVLLSPALTLGHWTAAREFPFHQANAGLDFTPAISIPKLLKGCMKPPATHSKAGSSRLTPASWRPFLAPRMVPIRAAKLSARSTRPRNLSRTGSADGLALHDGLSAEEELKRKFEE